MNDKYLEGGDCCLLQRIIPRLRKTMKSPHSE